MTSMLQKRIFVTTDCLLIGRLQFHDLASASVPSSVTDSLFSPTLNVQAQCLRGTAAALLRQARPVDRSGTVPPPSSLCSISRSRRFAPAEIRIGVIRQLHGPGVAPLGSFWFPALLMSGECDPPDLAVQEGPGRQERLDGG